MFQLYEDVPVRVWSEEELTTRDEVLAHLIKETRKLVQSLHPNMTIRRIEYPSIVPMADLRDRPHEAWRLQGTDLALSTGEGEGGSVAFLRHEMKSWTNESFPICYQYLSKNFRTENDRYTGEFRAWEFWQMDFDCYWTEGTIDFQPEVNQEFNKILEPLIGATEIKPEPEQTTDGEWKLNFDIMSNQFTDPVEVAGYSTRSQQPPFVEWQGPTLNGFNISYGVDRLVTARQILNKRG